MPGGKRVGAGRKPGVPNKVNAYTRAQAWAYCHNKGYNPVKHLVDLALDDKPTVLEQIQIARELLKYLMAPLRAMEPDTGQIGEDVEVILEGEFLAADSAEIAAISGTSGNGEEAL